MDVKRLCLLQIRKWLNAGLLVLRLSQQKANLSQIKKRRSRRAFQFDSVPDLCFFCLGTKETLALG